MRAVCAAPPADRDAINADALAAAGRLAESRQSWRIGTPYRDVAETVVRVTPARTAAVGVPEPVVRAWPGWPAAGVLGGGIIGGIAAVTAQAPTAGAVGVTLVGAGLGWAGQAVARWARVRRAVSESGVDGMLVAFGRTVAAAMGERAEVQVEPEASGHWVVRLAQADAARSQRFAEAVEQILAPIDFPRYIVSRRTGLRRAVMWHAVPDEFGVNKQAATAFLGHWQRFVSRGQILYTGSPEGAGIADTVRGLDPMDLTTAMYAQWG